MRDIKAIAKKLHEINFGDGGIIRTEFENGDYTYKDWKDNGDRHKYADGNCCCDKCDDTYNSCVISEEFKDAEHHYQFTNVSHGTHMYDFWQAHNWKNNADAFETEDWSTKIKDWSTKPVMFVMENPSNGKNNSYADDFGLNMKRPSKSWYWLDSSYNEKDIDSKYPKYFTQGEYGKLVYSIMNTFKIANGYLTNMVKCGVGYYNQDGTDVYTTTEKYNKGIIEKCIDCRLRSEISALRGDADDTVIVFAFALNTFNYLKEYLKAEAENGEINIYLLPHPASRLANDYRKYVLFGKIARALKLNNFYEGVEEIDYMSVLTSDKEVVPELKVKEGELADVIGNVKDDAQSYKDKSLKSFIGNLKAIICYDKYYCGKLTYAIKTVTGGFAVDLTLRYKAATKKKLEDGSNKVIWVNYSLADDYIETWVGKGDSANELISVETAEIFNLYKLMAVIVKRLKGEDTEK